jgi:hypothetical protein
MREDREVIERKHENLEKRESLNIPWAETFLVLSSWPNHHETLSLSKYWCLADEFIKAVGVQEIERVHSWQVTIEEG